MPVIEGEPDVLVTKDVNSAFLGEPRLEPWLRERGLREIVVAGIQTNMCCETTARMGGNLGFAVAFALDATCTFDLPDPIGGGRIDADTLARVTAANLHGEFAQVLSTASSSADDELRADRHGAQQPPHVGVARAQAALRHAIADEVGAIGAVDGEAAVDRAGVHLRRWPESARMQQP